MPWILLRDTQEKKIRRWRTASSVFFNHVGDVDRADLLNQRILEQLPNSLYDQAFRGAILEQRGTPESLRAALEVYQRLAETQPQAAPYAVIKQARLHRHLENFEAARALARSVRDEYPVAAAMNLGRTEIAAANPAAAIGHFHGVAQSTTATDLERAWAYESLASAYHRVFRLIGPSTPLATRAAIEKSQEHAITTAIRIVGELQDLDAMKRQIWLADLYLLRSELSRNGNPCLVGLDRLRDFHREHSKREPSSSTPPEFFAAMGRLGLGAAERLEEASRTERTEYALARLRDSLGHERGQARDLLATRPPETPEGKIPKVAPKLPERQIYIRRLTQHTALLLLSQEHQRILSDSSSLELSGRIDDAIASSDEDVKRTFQLARAFALVKARRETEARDTLDAHLASLREGERPIHALALAERCQQFIPQSKLSLRYLDATQLVGREIFRLFRRKTRILFRARLEPTLSLAADERLRQLRIDAETAAKTQEDHLQFAEFAGQLDGPSATIASLRQSIKKLTATRRLREELAHALLTQEKKREALSEYLPLYLEAPLRSSNVFDRTRHLLSAFDGDTALALALPEVIARVYPKAAPADLDHFARAMVAYFKVDHGAALAAFDAISAPDAFMPFLSFARGTAHLVLGEESDDEEARASQFTQAQIAFSSAPDYTPNRLEIVARALNQLGTDAPLPTPLLESITQLTASAELEHQGHWLLARAQFREFRRETSAGTLTRMRSRKSISTLQTTLRTVIQRHPEFVPAFQSLAATYAPGWEMKTSLKINHRRAAQVLAAVPSPTMEVLAQAAAHSLAAEDHAAAIPYCQALILFSPNLHHLKNLARAYAAAQRGNQLQILLNDKHAPRFDLQLNAAQQQLVDALLELPFDRSPNPDEVRSAWEIIRPSGTKKKSRLAVLVALRQRIAAMNRFDAMRHLVLAEFHEETAKATRDDVSEELISHFNEAVLAYMKVDEHVPTVVAARAAMELVESDEPELQRRALHLTQSALPQAAGTAMEFNLRIAHAWALFRDGQYREAKVQYRRVLADHDSPRVRFRLAQVLRANKENEQALVEVEKALADLRVTDELRRARKLHREIVRDLRKGIAKIEG